MGGFGDPRASLSMTQSRPRTQSRLLLFVSLLTALLSSGFRKRGLVSIAICLERPTVRKSKSVRLFVEPLSNRLHATMFALAPSPVDTSAIRISLAANFATNELVRSSALLSENLATSSVQVSAEPPPVDPLDPSPTDPHPSPQHQTIHQVLHNRVTESRVVNGGWHRSRSMRLTRTVAELEQGRTRAVDLMNKGESPTLIARILGVCRTSVYCWKKMAQADPKGLAAKPHPGRKARLTAEQFGELETLLLQGATKHGWPNILRTAQRVAEMMHQGQRELAC